LFRPKHPSLTYSREKIRRGYSERYSSISRSTRRRKVLRNEPSPQRHFKPLRGRTFFGGALMPSWHVRSSGLWELPPPPEVEVKVEKYTADIAPNRCTRTARAYVLSNYKGGAEKIIGYHPAKSLALGVNCAYPCPMKALSYFFYFFSGMP
jgi:hypothetical protein